MSNEEDVSKIIAAEEKAGGDSFGAEDEEHAEIGSAFFGIFTRSVMVKKCVNTRRKLQKNHDKHSQDDDSDRDENAHVKIISRRGLIFQNDRDSLLA